MKEVIKIEGKHPLNGTVRIGGAKNATVALMPAAILSKGGPVTVCGVPDISDVDSLIQMLEFLGCDVYIRENGETIVIDSTNMESKVIDHDSVNKLRASYYFMGAMLGKYGHVEIKQPGGCYLGPRPIDLHIKGFKALGATYSEDPKRNTVILHAEQLVGTKIFLDIASVGATINIMLAAVYAKGRTVIENAAKEPEIIDVANLLNKMGADITGAGTDVIVIEGMEALHGAFHEIIPDRIEAATYVILAAAAAEEVTVENVIPRHLEALTSKLIEMGVDLEIGIDSIVVRKSDKELKGIEIKTKPYPGFATDIQQPLTALLTQAKGTSKVTEGIYKERFKHCPELNKMGADIEVDIPTSRIYGATALYGNDVVATDLRCGACLVVAGLMAEGITTIHDIYHIERGYENIEAKLINLGANIWREKIED